jgi:hypothetical protein
MQYIVSGFGVWARTPCAKDSCTGKMVQFETDVGRCLNL